MFSKAFFLWAQPMIMSGVRTTLREDAAIQMPRRLRPARVYEDFEKAWRSHLASVDLLSDGGKTRKPSLFRVLCHLFVRDIGAAVVLQVVTVTCKFSSVLCLRRLVQIIGDETAGSVDGVQMAFALWASNLAVGLVSPLAAFRLQLALAGLVSCFAQAVLRKGLVLHPAMRESNRRGDLVSMALSDCSRLNEMSSILMQGASAPFMLAVAVALLCSFVGPIVLPSLAVICTSMYGVRQVGKSQGLSFRRKSVAQGRRLAILNEMLQSIRFTKYYTLEDHYEAQMKTVRFEEERFLRCMKLAYALNMPLACTVPVGMSIVVLMLYWSVHGRLPDAADTFAIIAAARSMYYPFYFFGGFLGGVHMFTAACGRLQSLLVLPEVMRTPLALPPDGADVDAAISIKGSSFTWSAKKDEAPALADIGLHLPPGELWAVVGEIGSGKSSLLAAVLGDMGTACAASGAAVHVVGTSRGSVAQEPFIMNASLRSNILFGVESDDQAAYEAALAVTALGPDLKALPARDSTEIGEKGITLSGGQKARVALARVVLAARPGGVVLLDDPLAAVDAHVGRHLFEQCICKALRGTSRLLVTNQLHFLDHPDVARVLVLENGRIVEQGSFRTLLNLSGSRLSRMAGTLGKSAWDSEPDVLDETASKRESLEASQPTVNKVDDASADEALTQKEHKEEGAISAGTLLFYARRMGGCHIVLLCCGCSWAIHLMDVLPDLFLAMWQDDLLTKPSEFYIYIWLPMATLGILVVVIARCAWVRYSLRASRRLHTGLVGRLMRCPTAFFDRTPSGRIMNRLGEDQAIVDWLAPLSLEVLCICFWRVFDVVAVAVFVRPLVAVVIAPFAMLFMCLREVHRRSTRETMRWWMVTKSPVFHTFEETLSGISTICAFCRADYFCSRFEDALCTNLRWSLSKETANNWAQQRLELLASTLVLALALLLVLTPGSASTSMAAVALVFSLTCGESLTHFTSFLVQVEGSFASVERVKEFTEQLEQEPPWRMPLDATLESREWPGPEAGLVLEQVSVRYLPHMPRALNSVSFQLSAREKVGVVGRTGSGKSTVIGALVRMFPLEEGRVLLGGVDISEVGVGLLRRQVTIVPQDPVLFSGELRRNLDPLAQRSDSEIWDVLRRSSLAELIQTLSGGLAASVAEAGSNFSVGERQVLCLVRALLRGTHVLCLDEATANVDPTNDARIQHILEAEVGNSLVLTIAHRLRTVLGSDRILVLDNGRVAQFDTPRELLTKAGIFRDLACDAGITRLEAE